MTYARIILKSGDGRMRTSFYLRIESENDYWLRGYRVRSDGSEIDGLQIIEKTTIKTRTAMRMNEQTGELEP